METSQNANSSLSSVTTEEDDSERTLPCSGDNEMESDGFLRMMNEIFYSRDRAIEAIADLKVTRNGILKETFEIATPFCLGCDEEVEALVLKSVEDDVQREFENRNEELKKIVGKFEARISNVKSIISNRIKKAFIVETIEKPEEKSNDRGSKIAAFVSICLVVLMFVMMGTYPNFHSSTFAHFFWKILGLVPLYLFCKVFYVCTKYTDDCLSVSGK